jgi:hypothetical protein
MVSRGVKRVSGFALVVTQVPDSKLMAGRFVSLMMTRLSLLLWSLTMLNIFKGASYV